MQLISYLDSLRPRQAEPQGRHPGRHRLHQGRPLRGARSTTPRPSPGPTPRGSRQVCESRLRTYRFYCSGVAGSTGQARRPLRQRDPRPAPHRAPRDRRAVRLADDPGPLSVAVHRCAVVRPEGAEARVWAEQAIFTSLPRRGKAGYHLVARSPGVTDAEAKALATWSPSHGALIVDAVEPDQRELPPAARRPVRPLADLRGAGRVQRPGRAAALHPRPDRRRNRTRRPADSSRSPSTATPWRWATSSTGPTRAEALEPVPLSRLHPRRDADSWADRAVKAGLARPVDSFVNSLLSGHPLDSPTPAIARSWPSA